VHDLVGLIKTTWMNGNLLVSSLWGTASLFRFLKKCDGKYYMSCITAAHNIVIDEKYAIQPCPTVIFELRRSGKEDELICKGTVETRAKRGRRRRGGAKLW
jgi:hypothetical protein